MPNEMIERVAEAIWGAGGGHDNISVDDARHRARAAIAAMREPSREMIEGFIRSKGYDPNEPADTMLKATVGVGLLQGWHAMIDAALGEKADGPPAV